MILLKKMSDPRLTGLTVTRAEVSDDIQHAKIYVRVLGTEGHVRSALMALKQAAGFIRSEVGEQLQTRYNPYLQFFLDESIDQEKRLHDLFRKLGEEKRERGELPADSENEETPEKDAESE